MSLRKILILCLIFTTLIIPLIQLSIGFYYVDSTDECPIQPDIMLLMSIGGVFEAIFFAAAFGFIHAIVPARYRTTKKSSAAQESAKGGGRGTQLLLGGITCIFTVCAMIFFVLLQVRVFGNYKKVQWKYPQQSTYCLYRIYSSAFGLIIASYVSYIVLFLVAVILLLGIGV